ncbi:MAG: hypothetical protein AAGG11_12415 [Pseudomonadota bacterium]
MNAAHERQQVLVLYLTTSALDTRVVGWSFYDGGGATRTFAGDAGDDPEPPYRTGLDALRDGWRLIQASPLLTHESGNEFVTAYLKYEFFFERRVPVEAEDGWAN